MSTAAPIDGTAARAAEPGETAIRYVAPRRRWRPWIVPAVVLGVLAYVPAMTARPGRMPADSKLYLYLDPGRLMVDAVGTIDPRQFAGWVPHQHIAYLWPSGPWFWLFDRVGAPDWIAHRLWIGSLLFAAGLGARWCARQLGLGALAALVAGIVYQVSPYVLPYVSRTSVMLLPWAGLGWLVALTVRGSRRGGWRDPAQIALVVLTVGAVNATALAMIVPGPVIWLAHAVWARLITWRSALGLALRTAALTSLVCAWWIVALVLQGRYGADVLRYSESLGDVSHTSTSPEVWRGLGYWLFYVRDAYAATTTESLRYLSSTYAIAISFAVTLACLSGLVWTRWVHRRFAALLVAGGALLAVGIHPIADPSPMMRVLTGDGESGIALALRSSTRALPVMNLGLALAAGALVAAGAHVHWRALWADRIVALAVVALALANMPGLWTGALVDPALERDQDPPDAWIDAAAALDAAGPGRVLMVPGTEFGAYRWGYTVDQPLPGLTDRDVVTRDLLPLGSAAAMDLWFAFDDRFQDGIAEPATVAPVAALFGADVVWLTNDVAFDRFRLARPEVVRSVVVDADEVLRVDGFGDAVANVPDVAVVDERALADPRVGDPAPPVELVWLEAPASIARAYEHTLLVAGDGAGVVDAAAAGLLTPDVGLRYVAGDTGLTPTDLGVLVTDSNRDRDRHWRSSQDTTGFTESGGPETDLLGDPPADARLLVFEEATAESQTSAVQRGPVVATASAYGEPYAYTPEHRASMAVDGNPATAWLVGEHGDPIGAEIDLHFPGGSPSGTLIAHQPDAPGSRRITAVELTEGDARGLEPSTTRRVALDPTGAPTSITIDPAATRVRLAISEVAGGTPFTGSAVSGVGFTELDVGLGATEEVVRTPAPPRDLPTGLPYGLVLTRQRVDPMDRWRSDPEPLIVREFDLDAGHEFVPSYTMRIDRRASDAALAEVFDWPVVGSSRLAGSIRSAGIAAVDGDPATAWTTGFDDALGATLTIDRATAPIDSLAITQPTSGTSQITEVTIRTGNEARTLAISPDGRGRAVVAVEPPLPAGDVEVELTGVDDSVTFDRRFGDPVALPVSITELEFDGAPRVAPLGSERQTIECHPVASIDGAELTATLTIDGSGWLDGAPVAAVPCQPQIDLAAGTHLVRGIADVWQLDRIVLDDGLTTALAEAGPARQVGVIERDRFGGRFQVAGCPSGCWFTFGEGYNPAWAASVGGVDLGPPTLIDGGFNGWWMMPSEEPFRVDVTWTVQRPQTIALAISAIAALVCVVVAVWLRDPHEGGAPLTAVSLSLDRRRLERSEAAAAAVLWVVAAGLVAGPWGLVWGGIGGLALWFSGNRDLPVLTTFATISAIAAFVTIAERRWAPLPDGGWPVRFEQVHDLGMFAIATLVVAAVVADDGRAEGRQLPSGP